jgi:hypothetical protein
MKSVTMARELIEGRVPSDVRNEILRRTGKPAKEDLRFLIDQRHVSLRCAAIET